MTGIFRGLTLPVVVAFMAFFSGISCVNVSYPVIETYWENTTVSENHTVTYTRDIPVTQTRSGEQALTPYIVWSSPELEFNGLKHFWYYGYSLPKHDESTVRILFLKQHFYEFVRVYVYDFNERGQILAPPLIAASENVSASNAQLQGVSTWNNWINSADTKLTFGRHLAALSDLWLNYESDRTLEFDTHGSTEIALIITGPSLAQNTYFTARLLWSDYSTENVSKSSEQVVATTVQQPVQKTRSSMQIKQVPFWEVLLNH